MEATEKVKLTKKQREALEGVSDCVACGSKFSQETDSDWMLIGDFRMRDGVIHAYGLCPKCGPKYYKGATSLMRKIMRSGK